MRREVKWAGIGCAGLLGVFMLLGIIGALANRGVDRPAEPTPTAVAQQRPATVAPAQPAKPTEAPPTAVPSPATAVERLVIAGAGAEGVNLRAEPSATAGRVKLLRDGAQLEIVGEDRPADGRTWRNVKDASDGATGWVAAEFVVAASAAPQSKPAAPATPGAQPAPPAAAPKPGSGMILCRDGSIWTRPTRQGACSGRGGIAPGY